MGSHPQPISATIMASWLKTIPLLLFVLPFTFASRELHNACGLKMQVLSSSSSMTTMLRCEDTLSRRNPRWNITDVSGRTLGQLRLQGVGFSAVSIPWRNDRKEGECGMQDIHQLCFSSKPHQERRARVPRRVDQTNNLPDNFQDNHLPGFLPNFLVPHLLPHEDNLWGLLETLWSPVCSEEWKLSRNMEPMLSVFFANYC